MTDGVQLVRVMDAFGNHPNTREFRELALQAASRGHVHLYILLPEGFVACTEAIAARQPTSLGRAVSVMQRRQVIRARARGTTVIESPEFHPELRYLTLPAHSVALMQAASIVKVAWFNGGLRLRASQTTEPARLTRGQHLPPICLRPVAGTEQQSGGFRMDGRSAPPEHEACVGVDDLLISTRAAFRVHQVAELAADPFPRLRGRAVGIIALYRAFRQYYSVPPATEEESKRMRERAKLYLRRFDRTIFTAGRAIHAAHLIDPRHIRTQGKATELSDAFDEDVINSDAVQAYQRRDPQMTTAFALVLHATELLYRQVPSGASTGMLAIEAEKLLTSFGFRKSGQRGAIAHIMACRKRSARA